MLLLKGLVLGAKVLMLSAILSIFCQKTKILYLLWFDENKILTFLTTLVFLAKIGPNAKEMSLDFD